MSCCKYFLQEMSLLVTCLLFSSIGAYPSWMGTPTLCHSESSINNTTLMPYLPQQYSTLVEANFVLKDRTWSAQMEEHIDGVNKRASVASTFNSQTTRGIFNSDPVERLDIQPVGKCTSHPELEQFHIFAFLITKPIKASTSGFFHLASRINTTYIGLKTIRGINVDHWTFCQEWTSQSAKFTFDYYFTRKGHESVWGQGQFPVRVTVGGNTGNLNIPGVPESQDILQTFDFTSFRPGPHDDVSVFQIPHDVVCTGRTVTKLMPQLTDQFQMDVELAMPIALSSVPMQVSLRYDWTNQMIETVRGFPQYIGFAGAKNQHVPVHIRNEESKSKDKSEVTVVRRVSWVEDYYSGLQYMTELSNMTCAVRPLPTAYQSMSHGSALLRIGRHQRSLSTGSDTKFSYQGKSTFRTMPVESWGMDDGGIVQKVFFLSRTQGADVDVNTTGLTKDQQKELSAGMKKVSTAPFPKFPILMGMVLKNRTSLESRDMPRLVRELVNAKVLAWSEDLLKLKTAVNISQDNGDLINLEKFGSWVGTHDIVNEHIGEMDLDVYHFLPLHSDGNMFHVSQCYSPQQKARVILTVRTSFSSNVRHDPTAFSNAMRMSVAKAMGVSAIQLADFSPKAVVNKEKNIDLTVITMTLLGSPPVKETRKTQIDIETAKKRLKAAVHHGITFKVKYPHQTKAFIVDKDLVAFDTGLEEFSIVREAMARQAKPSRDSGNNNLHSSEDVNDDKSGYSGSILAGAIVATMVLTCSVTIFIAVLISKMRKQHNFPGIPFKATKEEMS